MANHKNCDRAQADGRARVDHPRGAERVVRGGGWCTGARGRRSAKRSDVRKDSDHG